LGVRITHSILFRGFGLAALTSACAYSSRPVIGVGFTASLGGLGVLEGGGEVLERGGGVFYGCGLDVLNEHVYRILQSSVFCSLFFV